MAVMYCPKCIVEVMDLINHEEGTDFEILNDISSLTEVTNGIINGINETDFGTGKSITRQDLVTVLYRMIEKNVKTC